MQVGEGGGARGRTGMWGEEGWTLDRVSEPPTLHQSSSRGSPLRCHRVELVQGWITACKERGIPVASDCSLRGTLASPVEVGARAVGGGGTLGGRGGEGSPVEVGALLGCHEAVQGRRGGREGRRRRGLDI